jgi:Zn-dependent peptidase ImmA (M78 family)
MKSVPVRIATSDSAADVTNEVRRLLRAAGIKNQLPTPKEEILACQRLVVTGELDLAEYEATLTEKALRFFHKAVSKILGILDRRSDIIYVDPHVHDSRKLFVTYHEVTHSVLGWQRMILTQEDEVTLSAECEDLFEAEANYGAADILFQCERFEKEARDYELSMESALLLSNRYEASCHATLRRFAERNHRPCLLMVLTPTLREHTDGKKSYYVVYSIPSIPFVEEFGDQLNLTFVNPGHDLGKILNDGLQGEIALPDAKGFLRACRVQTFSNGYKMFALISPKQAISSRKIVHFNF